MTAALRKRTGGAMRRNPARARAWTPAETVQTLPGGPVRALAGIARGITRLARLRCGAFLSTICRASRSDGMSPLALPHLERVALRDLVAKHRLGAWVNDADELAKPLGDASSPAAHRAGVAVLALLEELDGGPEDREWRQAVWGEGQ